MLSIDHIPDFLQLEFDAITNDDLNYIVLTNECDKCFHQENFAKLENELYDKMPDKMIVMDYHDDIKVIILSFIYPIQLQIDSKSYLLYENLDSCENITKSNGQILIGGVYFPLRVKFTTTTISIDNNTIHCLNINNNLSDVHIPDNLKDKIHDNFKGYLIVAESTYDSDDEYLVGYEYSF